MLVALLLPETFAISFTFHAKDSPACKPSNDLQHFLHNSELQEKITKDWIRTHELSNWKVSRPVLVTNPSDFAEIAENSIPFPHNNNEQKMFYFKTEYDSTVKLPSILKPIMKTTIYTHTVKKSFVVGNREFKVIEVSNIPLISSIKIYSKMIMYPNGVIASKNDVATGHVPWYADWAKGHIRKEITNSAQDYQKMLSNAMC